MSKDIREQVKKLLYITSDDKVAFIKENNMSKELREQINRVKNWKQFLNENNVIKEAKPVKL